MSHPNQYTPPYNKRTADDSSMQKSHKKKKRLISDIKKEFAALKRDEIEVTPKNLFPDATSSPKPPSKNNDKIDDTKVNTTISIESTIKTYQVFETITSPPVVTSKDNECKDTVVCNPVVPTIVTSKIKESNYNNTSYLNIIRNPPPFCEVLDDMILVLIQKYTQNTTASLPHLSKMLYNNFNVVFHSKAQTRSKKTDKAVT